MIGKIRNKDVQGVSASNPFGEELILAPANYNSSSIRAFGIDTETDLGVFYTASISHFAKILELKEIRNIALLGSNGNYLELFNIDSRTIEYIMPTFDNFVNDCVVYNNFLIVGGNFTNYLKVIDLNTMLEISGFPTFDGAIYGLSVLNDGRLACVGNFTNNLKIINFNTKEEIAGYPTYSYNFSGNNNNRLVTISEIINNSNLLFVFQDVGTSSNYRRVIVDINSKTEVYNTAGTNSSSEQSFSFDGNRMGAGGNNTSTQNEIWINSSGGISSVGNGTSNLALWVVANKARTHRYVKGSNNTNLYKFTYSGTTAIDTFTFNPNYTHMDIATQALVTDLLKGT